MIKLTDSYTVPIIGYHRAPLSQKFGAPRQPNLVALASVIEMIAPYNTPAAFIGLDDFSHLWISWQFHHNELKQHDSNKAFRAQVRPPRLGGNQKIGVFASRSMYRPSSLGLSVVKLERVERIDKQVLLLISGADMIDGTPIIDIKPYIAYSDSIHNTSSGFAPDAPANLTVSITASAREEFEQQLQTQLLSVKDSAFKTYSDIIYKHQQRLNAADLEQIKALIAQDPRPAYRRDELNSVFTMRYKSIDISFCQIKKGELQIVAVVSV